MTQFSNTVLDSEIRSDTNYSKQQETLIVWSEDSSDLALSFQEKMGCEEIWERICQQQVLFIVFGCQNKGIFSVL